MGELEAIVDTNVMLDIYGIGDLEDAYERSKGADTPDTLFRRARSREATILSWYLHERRATSVSLKEEMLRIFRARADPEKLGTLKSQHVQMTVYFVIDYVLDGWNSAIDHSASGSDLGLEGEECDDQLIKLAQKYCVPLITNEGYSISGVSSTDPKKIRAKCIAAGVPVYTPRQFWRGKIGEGAACRKYLERLDAVAPKYLKGHTSDAGPAAVQIRRNILRHIFYGHTADGRVLPVRI